MKMTRREVEKKLREHEAYIQWFAGYSEPGYRDPARGVLLADWNPKELREIAENAERFGYEIEWEDEWVECGECYKVFRTSPNSSMWQWSGAYWPEGEATCARCLRSHYGQEYLKSLENHPRKCLTFEIGLKQYGYQKYENPEGGYKGGYTTGLHIGMDDDPQKIAAQLREAGITRFLYVQDGQGQFETDFSLWIHRSEWKKLPQKINPHGFDPGKAMERMVASTIKISWKKKAGGTVETIVILVPIEFEGHLLALHFVTD